MESTYGSDMEFGRMFDQYMHKGNPNFDLSLSITNTNSHLSYMAEQANSYTPYESRGNAPQVSAGNPSESYADLASLNPHESTHPSHSAITHALQSSHPHQAMYQMGVPPLHDGNVQFPPQNLYIPPISQSAHGLVQPGGYLGSGMGHPSLVYTSAGLGMPSLHPQSMMSTAGAGMMPNPYFPRPQMIKSGSSPTSGGGSPSPNSEDSDDSNHLAHVKARMKRPSPLPDILTETVGPTKGKKARVSKKSKKKKDPNEPQKPVSAYALFFRDTQASIKGDNPNASFGEVSKIVAAMWDGLGGDLKSAYKRKTEVAKKEYLKKLAAYRATLVSQGEGDPGIYNQASQPYGQLPGPPTYGYPVTTSAGQMPHPQGHSPPQLSMPKKSPLLNPLMTADPQQLMNPPMSQPMPPSAPSMMSSMGGFGTTPASMASQCPPQSTHQAMVQGAHISQMNPGPPSPFMTPQANQSLSSPVSSLGSDVGSPVGHTLHTAHQQQLSPHAPMPQQSPHSVMQQQQHSPPNHHALQNQAPVNHQQTPNQGSGPLQVPSAPQMCNGSTCLRSGCNNPAVNNPEWEEEYCSNECVVSHCRDVFSTWVTNNQQNSQIYPAPVK